MYFGKLQRLNICGEQLFCRVYLKLRVEVFTQLFISLRSWQINKELNIRFVKREDYIEPTCWFETLKTHLSNPFVCSKTHLSAL